MKCGAAVLLIAIVTASPAAAHKLRVFATVEGREVRGYAFFVGGGRPEGSAWVAKGAGNLIASGTTDAEGRFAFGLPATGSTDVTVTVDTREAHTASATLSASRLIGATAVEPPASVSALAKVRTAQNDPELAALVAASVQKEIVPLLERLEAMDTRLRYTDMLSGVFLIIGLCGIGLSARRRRC
ncbi:MAG: cobalamin biosynthesis protein CbiL [Xanthobacteraceae bacterium]|jgi:nickel transport protein|nr:cobalamin biosynthesis protein CbiL [Xanthobacteraceae bacterium]MDF2809403.1 cobalamin biosynthesis protein CbiL [Microvirga sp.]